MVKVTIWVENGIETWKIEEVKYLDIDEGVQYFKQCLKDMPTKEKVKPTPPQPDENISEILHREN